MRQALTILLTLLGTVATISVHSETPDKPGEHLNGTTEPVSTPSFNPAVSTADKIEIARQLTAAEKFRQAGEILAALLAVEPENAEARVQLARVRARAGDFTAAIKEADVVLNRFPDYRAALLVKADALRQKKNLLAAIWWYNKLLEPEEHFAARLGLAYALLLSGDKQRALENSRLLQPQGSLQEEELEELRQALDRATRPNADLRYSHYEDSDGNQSDRYATGLSFWIRNWKWHAGYQHTEASGESGVREARDVFVKTHGQWSESLNLGGGLGVVQFDNGRMEDFFIGHLKADVAVPNGRAGAHVAREALTATAQLIENRIRLTDMAVFFSQTPYDRMSLDTTYHRKEYSDNNDSHDAQFAAQYALYRRIPRIDIGYRFRYLRFERQSRSGYFDPDWFRSHEAFTNVSFEYGKYYGYIEPSLGHQSFFRNGAPTSDLFGAGTGALGFRPSKNVLLEAYIEGGNYALGTATGFRYSLFGMRLGYMF